MMQNNVKEMCSQVDWRRISKPDAVSIGLTISLLQDAKSEVDRCDSSVRQSTVTLMTIIVMLGIGALTGFGYLAIAIGIIVTLCGLHAHRIVLHNRAKRYASSTLDEACDEIQSIAARFPVNAEK